MKYAIMVLALVGVLATPRLASAFTWNDLYTWCKADRNFCVVYIEGWVNGVTAKSIARRQKDLFGHPKNEDLYAEQIHYTAEILAWLAFRNAWPRR